MTDEQPSYEAVVRGYHTQRTRAEAAEARAARLAAALRQVLAEIEWAGKDGRPIEFLSRDVSAIRAALVDSGEPQTDKRGEAYRAMRDALAAYQQWATEAPIDDLEGLSDCAEAGDDALRLAQEAEVV